MVYAATFAAGLVFWGAAETLYHYQTVPPMSGAEAQSAGAMISAMQYTLFHWGISPWVGHLIIAVPLALYVHKHDVPSSHHRCSRRSWERITSTRAG